MSLPDHRRRSSLLFCPRAPVQSTGESRKAVTGGAPAVTGGGAEVVTFAAASLALGYIRSRSVQNKCHGNMAVILHAMQNWRKQKQTALTGQKLLNGPDWLETLPKPKGRHQALHPLKRPHRSTPPWYQHGHRPVERG